MFLLRPIVTIFAIFFLSGFATAQSLQPDADASTNGWVVSFAAGDLPQTAEISLPQRLDTVLESGLREAISTYLLNTGFSVTDEECVECYSVSYKVSERKESFALPPGQSIGLSYAAPGDEGRYTGADAAITAFFGALEYGVKHDKVSNGSLQIGVIVSKGNERVWSGFAAAERRGGARGDIVEGMADILLQSFGEAARIDDATFDVTESGKYSFTTVLTSETE
ncbi:hypothetical protein PUV54_04045 [Hyphococcus flavus]|uniref:DUF4136 domain-containing protein n=1 Tax=Hyphococcus flavus TaxID=1866326 RepID=A0AAE9ZCH0_9PROT|nr:hypothetical protein [Hyphococcus flavus]WDI32363.1 hypothetical protein PUV54_04045 [Hyphococcus flavus]